MRVLTVSCFSPLWKRYPANVLDLEDGPTIGGGEENFIRCSTGLRELGHEVVAYHCGERGVWRGVEFRSLEDPLYPVIVGEKWDAIAAWSGLRPLEYARPGVKRLFVQQLNDLSNLGDWNAVDCVVSPSLDHARELRTWGWQGRQAVVHNGCDLDLYQPAPDWDSRPMDVGYWSSPDRGLHHLLRAWPLILQQVSNAKLHVFYEIKNYLRMISILPASFYGERGQTVARLLLGLIHDPSVTFHGAVPRKKLAKIQKQCRVMAYPYEVFGYCEGFCHPAGTLVTTIEGMKPVEQLSLRDKVLGRSGEWRAITSLESRRFEGKLVKILPTCGESVEFTGDHPILVAASEASEFKWVRADQVKAGMWLFSAQPKSVKLPESVEIPTQVFSPEKIIGQRLGSETLGGKAPIFLPGSIPVTPQLCRIVGYFAGDGNAPIRGRGRWSGSASFFFGTEQKKTNVDDLRDCLQGVFGTPGDVQDFRPVKKMFAVRVFSASIARALSTWCYASDGKKRLPEWAMTLPPDFTKEILKGLWRTDGSVVEISGSRFAGFTSSSPYLIDQVRTLLKIIGRTVRMQHRVHPNGNISWSVYFSIADEFLDYPGRRTRDVAPGFRSKQVDGGVMLKVREVEERFFSDTVYSMSVDVDESYHVGNFLVHNCGSVNQSLAAGCLTMANPRDALPSLYGDAVHWLTEDTLSLDYHKWLANQVVCGLRGDLPNQDAIRARGPKKAYPWVDAHVQMEKACQGDWLPVGWHEAKAA